MKPRLTLKVKNEYLICFYTEWKNIKLKSSMEIESHYDKNGLVCGELIFCITDKRKIIVPH